MASRDGFDVDAVASFLRPRSVAIVGISGAPPGAFRPGGRAVFEHLRSFGYAGQLYPVNPKYEEIAGVRAYPSLASLPEAPECAVVAVPAASVPGVIEECAAAGVLRVLLLSSGFGELGPEGADLERRLRDAAAAGGVRILGPNTTGIINVADATYLTMTSVLATGGALRRGPSAMLLQSGALGSCVVDRARRGGVGADYVVSLGNQVDLDAADFLAYLASDDRIEAVSLYAEGIPDGPRYRSAVERLVAAGKSLFVLMGGSNELGERAAMSHTGRMAGRASLERSIFEFAGATLVEEPDDLWQAPHLRAQGADRRSGPTVGVGIFTISGGLGVISSDKLGALGGFALPPVGALTAAALKPWLPAYVGAQNPLDLGPGTMPDGFAPSLAAFIAEPAFAVIAVVLPVVASAWQGAVVDGILAARASSAKAVIVCWYAGDSAQASIAGLRSEGVIVVETPAELARVLATVRGPLGIEPAKAAVRVDGSGVIDLDSDWTVLSAVAAAGGDVAPMSLATEDSAEAAAAEIGWPVVVKALVPGVAHKTEHGLVAVGIASPDELQEALEQLRSAAAQLGVAAPELLVQGMAQGGVEIVLSIRRDPRLGAFVGVGLGGTLIEILGDIRYSPYPLGPDDLDRLLESLVGRELLAGYRGRPGVDREWIGRTLAALVAAAEQLGAAELEVNPAFVRPDGGVIVDALAVPAAAA